PRRVTVTLLAVLLPLLAHAQAAIEVVGATAEIPRNSFKTWSIFLVCNPDWITPTNHAQLVTLYDQFRAFGRAIGDDNAAVWFWKKRTSIEDPRLADNVDIERAARYCQRLKLQPTAGPFLVVTDAYPVLNNFPNDRAVFEMGGLSATEAARLL